jgi:hypothetical protein
LLLLLLLLALLLLLLLLLQGLLATESHPHPGLGQLLPAGRHLLLAAAL